MKRAGLQEPTRQEPPRATGFRTQLLVSVRSVAEAEAALAGGADVIDIKEPARGSLGPADPALWRQVRAFVGRRAVVTAALGELLRDPVQELAGQASGMRFVKVGFAGCQATRGWMEKWHALQSALPPDVHVVPVAYADWIDAAAPSPSASVALAALAPARLLLVDTFFKTGSNLLQTISGETFSELIDYARTRRVQLALAGALDAAAIEELLPLAPAYIGVRGAACRGGRDGSIEIARVKSLALLVHAQNSAAPG